MSYLLPGLILLLLLYGLFKGVDIHAAFIEGAAEALPLLLKLLPYMAAMMAALTTFRLSGLMETVTALLGPWCGRLGLPGELAPLFLLRPFSGGAAVALLKDVYAVHGPDSYLGYAASIMLGSTETIFYTLSLYFGAAGVKKSRHAVPAALAAGLVGAVAAIVFAARCGV